MAEAMNPDVDSIRARQKRIFDEIEKLQKEFDELSVALRVLDRFTKAKPPDQPPKPAKAPKASRKALPPRPKGIPSTFEMVEKILTEGEATGKPELTSRELMDQIREKYWPGVQNKQILPSIFGFGKAGRIIREGDKWKRKHAGRGNLFS
jgi:hypothetical protein